MAGIYGTDSQSFVINELRAGGNCETIKITIKSGAGALGKGQIVGMETASNACLCWSPSASDGTEVARAVLNEDIDATSAAVSGQAITGKIRADKLIFGTSTSAQKATAVKELQQFGVLLDKDILEVIS